MPYQPAGHPFASHLNPPSHIQMPVNYPFDFGPSSAPTSPYEAYPPHHGHLQTSMSHSYSQLQAHPVDELAATLSTTNVSSNPIPETYSPSHSPASQSPSAPNRSHSHSHHHAHPGPISLPPPPLVTSFSPVHHPSHLTLSMSPSHLHHPLSPQHSNHVTPHGLPPITPSMPPFIFLPQLSTASYNPNHHSATPISTPNQNGIHPHSHLLSPFSPGVTMSPGAFWGHGGANPFINPTVGAPVHNENEYFDVSAAPGSHMSPGPESMPRNDSLGYFPPVPPGIPNQDVGYFPLMSSSFSEILRDKSLETPEKQGEFVEEPRKEAVESSSSETDAETVERASSSEATSLHASDEVETWVSNVRGRNPDGWNGEAETGETVNNDGDEDQLTSDKHTLSRAQSLSSSNKKPVLVHRPDSDPIMSPAPPQNGVTDTNAKGCRASSGTAY